MDRARAWRICMAGAREPSADRVASSRVHVRTVSWRRIPLTIVPCTAIIAGRQPCESPHVSATFEHAHMSMHKGTRRRAAGRRRRAAMHVAAHVCRAPGVPVSRDGMRSGQSAACAANCLRAVDIRVVVNDGRALMRGPASGARELAPSRLPRPRVHLQAPVASLRARPPCLGTARRQVTEAGRCTWATLRARSLRARAEVRRRPHPPPPRGRAGGRLPCARQRKLARSCAAAQTPPATIFSLADVNASPFRACRRGRGAGRALFVKAVDTPASSSGRHASTLPRRPRLSMPF